MKPNAIKLAWETGNKCFKCPVRSLVLFSDLQQEDFNLLHKPIDDYDLQVGESLYQESDPAKYVYTIRSGMIKLVYYLANGSYKIVRLLQQGDLAGIEALSGSQYLHHAIVLEKVSICRIAIEDINLLNQSTPHLYKQLTVRWQKVQSDANIWLAELTMGSSKQRVANLLLYLNRASTSDSFYLPSREDIGALLSITTETASRIIAQFKRLGYLETHTHYAKINKTKLQQIT